MSVQFFKFGRRDGYHIPDRSGPWNRDPLVPRRESEFPARSKGMNLPPMGWIAPSPLPLHHGTTHCRPHAVGAALRALASGAGVAETLRAICQSESGFTKSRNPNPTLRPVDFYVCGSFQLNRVLP